MMTDTPPTFGTNLRRLRSRAGLTVRELARRAGLHGSFIWRIEKGERVPSVDVAHKLAGVIGCRIDDFYREEGR